MTTVTIEQAIRLALDHQNAGRPKETEAICEQVLKVDPRNPAALFLAGVAKLNLGQADAAEAMLRAALDAQPDLSDASLALWNALVSTGRSREGLAVLHQAAAHNPNDVRIVTQLLPLMHRLAVKEFPSPHGPIRFACFGGVPLWRAQTLMTKEPETLEWIDAFDHGDVFWDIGANVGLYTLYAAKAGKAARILAFEPAAGNYMLLNRNIEENRADANTHAYCLAFAAADLLDVLNMQNTELGGALSSFGLPVDNNGQVFDARFRQGALGFSIDGFVRMFAPPFPNRIKIDVDGIEDQIIQGARATLSDHRMKSLSVELDDARPDYRDRVIAIIESCGLRFTRKRQSAMLAEGPYANIYNFHFLRDGWGG